MARKSFSKFPVKAPTDLDVHSIEFNNSVSPACKPDSNFFFDPDLIFPDYYQIINYSMQIHI